MDVDDGCGQALLRENISYGSVSYSRNIRNKVLLITRFLRYFSQYDHVMESAIILQYSVP